jgi:hypothetical protein
MCSSCAGSTRASILFVRMIGLQWNSGLPEFRDHAPQVG